MIRGEGMEEVIEKAKELNEISTDINLTLKEKQDYVDTLTELEMRNILKAIMTVYVSKE